MIEPPGKQSASSRAGPRAGSGSPLTTLTKGDTKTFRDKTKVKLLVGNAGAVSLKVNGRDLGAPGASGQVVKVDFGPGDPTVSAA